MKPPRLLWVSLLLVGGSLACQQDDAVLAPAIPLPQAHERPSVPPGPSLSFSQLDVTLSEERRELSEWALTTLEFTGSDDVLFFNLTVGDVWRIQNLPVLSREGPGVRQVTSVTFDLGVAPGTAVNSLSFDFALTLFPLEDMPTEVETVSVGRADYRLRTCLLEAPIRFTPPTPTLVGGRPMGKKVTRRRFPNQEAGVNECVPAAVSNSLQWLVRTRGLRAPARLISIAAMKRATGWTRRGAPGNWSSRKSGFLRRNKIPVTTRKLPRLNMSRLRREMRKGCDVELQANNHLVSVTGIQKLANGNFSLDLTHDTKQGKRGGTLTQTVIFNTKSKTFSGAKWINGKQPMQIVAECAPRRSRR
ncbi:MAG: hypothetical protein ACE5HQ_13995 [Gemmatimonadota bacterium]